MKIIIITIIISIILYIYFKSIDKLNIYKIKFKNIEEKINNTLIIRKELLKESEAIIKDITKTEKTIYEGFSEINYNINDIIKLDRNLLVYVNEFYIIKDKYKDLMDNNDFQKINFKINETEDLLKAYKEYYNEAAGMYNKLIKSFPINIINIFKRRKKKLCFD